MKYTHDIYHVLEETEIRKRKQNEFRVSQFDHDQTASNKWFKKRALLGNDDKFVMTI